MKLYKLRPHLIFRCILWARNVYISAGANYMWTYQHLALLNLIEVCQFDVCQMTSEFKFRSKCNACKLLLKVTLEHRSWNIVQLAKDAKYEFLPQWKCFRRFYNRCKMLRMFNVSDLGEFHFLFVHWYCNKRSFLHSYWGKVN